jgi:hypothetical protein
MHYNVVYFYVVVPEILIWFSWNKKTEGTAKRRTFQQTTPYLVESCNDLEIRNYYTFSCARNPRCPSGLMNF